MEWIHWGNEHHRAGAWDDRNSVGAALLDGSLGDTAGPEAPVHPHVSNAVLDALVNDGLRAGWRRCADNGLDLIRDVTQ